MSDWFLDAAGGLAAIGCGIAALTPFLAGGSAAFGGSLLASGLLGLVFALQNLRRYRVDGYPSLPPAVVTTVFGLWFAVAPLLYDPGFLGTAGVQLGGLLTASFAGYMVLSSFGTPASTSDSRDRSSS